MQSLAGVMRDLELVLLQTSMAEQPMPRRSSSCSG